MAIEQASFYCLNCKTQRLFTRQGTNHVVHLLVTLFLCGLWIPVWILIAIGDGSKPYFCGQCGYSNTPRNLANPILTHQNMIAASHSAKYKAQNPQLNDWDRVGNAWERFKISKSYAWLADSKNTWKVAVVTATAVISGGMLIFALTDFPSPPQPSPNIVATPTAMPTANISTNKKLKKGR